MAKSAAHFEQPDSSKGRQATQEEDLKPRKSDLKVGRDQDWHFAGKQQGQGFSGNATAAWHFKDNPAAGEYRNPPEHKYRVTDSGQGSGEAKTETQNRLAGSKRK